MKIIPLTRGYEALVDDEDYDDLMLYSWYFCAFSKNNSNGYACHSSRLEDALFSEEKRTIVFMHLCLLKAPRGFVVNHIDGNGLNNCRSNLRICTLKNAQRGSKKTQYPVSSLYKGVSLCSYTGRWVAQITVDRRAIRLGRFKTQEEAARAYDQAARQHFGEFARLNFQEDRTL